MAKRNRLKDIAKRASLATPGPWTRWEGHSDVYCGNDGENYSLSISGNCVATCRPEDLPDFEDERADDEYYYVIQSERNAEFIAHARVDIEYLLKRIAKLSTIKEEAKA